MKKYFVIGNPIDHSLSPKLHNYWLNDNKIKASYHKKKLDISEIKDFILNIKKNDIFGVNITVPFKKEIIPYLNELSPEAKATQSVNTISLDGEKMIGHNTDVGGFELGIKNKNFQVKNKKIFTPKKDYYEGNTYKFFKSKVKRIIKQDILVKDLKNYDEILLVGSGKGVASVKMIKQINWKRKNLKVFKLFSKYYISEIKRCNKYKF